MSGSVKTLSELMCNFFDALKTHHPEILEMVASFHLHKMMKDTEESAEKELLDGDKPRQKGETLH